MIALDSLVYQFAETSLRISVAIAALLLLRPLLRRVIGSQWLCILWLLILGRLLLPVSVESPWSVGGLHELRFAGQTPGQAQSDASLGQTGTIAPDWNVRVTETAGTEEANSSSDRTMPGKVVHAHLVPCAIWVIGALAGLIALGLRVRQTRWLSRQTEPVTDSSLLEVFESIEPKLRRGIKLRTTNAISVPTLAGLFHPQIWIPQRWLARLSPEEMRHVLLHELGHACRRDLLVQRLFLVAQCLHWFNPLVWLAVHLAKADREMACDAWVLGRENEDDSPEYGFTLLKIVKMLRAPVSVSPLLIEMAVSRRDLTERVRAIGNFQHVAAWRGVVIIVAAIVGLVVVTTTTAQTEKERGNTKTTVSEQIPEIQSAGAKSTGAPDTVVPTPDQSKEEVQVELEVVMFEAPLSVWAKLKESEWISRSMRNALLRARDNSNSQAASGVPTEKQGVEPVVGRLDRLASQVAGVLTRKQSLAQFQMLSKTDGMMVGKSEILLAPTGKPSNFAILGKDGKTRTISIIPEVSPDKTAVDLALTPQEGRNGRLITTSVSIFSGQSVLLLSLQDITGKDRDKLPEGNGQMYFITAEVVGKSPGILLTKPRVPQVEVGAKFYELTEKAVRELNLSALIQTAEVNGNQPVIWTQTQRETFEQAVGKMQADTITLVSGPRVTTRSKQRAVIEIIREVRDPATWEKDPNKPGSWLVKEYETTNTGATLEVEPEVKPDGMIALELQPQIVEALGFVDLETGMPAPGHKPRSRSQVSDELLKWMQGVDFSFNASNYQFVPGHRNNAVFSKRKAQQKVELKSGQSAVMLLKETEDTKPFEAEAPKKPLIVIITANEIGLQSM